MSNYLITVRQPSAGGFGDNPGAPVYLAIPDDVIVPGISHVVPPDRWSTDWLKPVIDAVAGDQSPYSISSAGDILIFIHGYNNGMTLVLQRQRMIADMLKAEGWHGIVIGFDWPSGDEAWRYIDDRTKAAATAHSLIDGGITKLAASQRNGCSANVHLLAHSTGAFVVMEACLQAQNNMNLHGNQWQFAQVAFIAGDVAADSLSESSQWSTTLYSRLRRLTNYSNGHDGVLAVSNAKRLGVSPRAGRVGLPDDAGPKAINVDCTDHFCALPVPGGIVDLLPYSHSWYFNDRVWARDLAMCLEGLMDRHTLPTRATDLTGNVAGLILQDQPRPSWIGGAALAS